MLPNKIIINSSYLQEPLLKYVGYLQQDTGSIWSKGYLQTAFSFSSEKVNQGTSL